MVSKGNDMPPTIAATINETAVDCVQKKAFALQESREIDRFDPETRIQSSVYDCNSIGVLWRYLIRTLAFSEYSNDQLREIRTKLTRAFYATKTVCQEVLTEAECIQKEQGKEDEFQSLSDLKIFVHELSNIEKWLNCWPSSGHEHRAAIREEIRRGDFVSRNDLRGEIG